MRAQRAIWPFWSLGDTRRLRWAALRRRPQMGRSGPDRPGAGLGFGDDLRSDGCRLRYQSISEGAWIAHVRCARQAVGDGSVSYDALELDVDVAGQTSLAQGIACRLSQCTRDDRHHQVEEPNAQPAGGLFIKTTRAVVKPMVRVR